MAWIFGGRVNKADARPLLPPCPQQAHHHQHDQNESQKLERYLIQQQMFQQQQQQQLQQAQQQQQQAQQQHYKQQPANQQVAHNISNGSPQSVPSARRLKYQALDRIEVHLAPAVRKERDALLANLEILQCMTVDINRHSAQYGQYDLSLERHITRAAEESVIQRSKQEGPARNDTRKTPVREDSLTESLLAIASIAAAEEVERKEKDQLELAAINKCILEMEASRPPSETTSAVPLPPTVLLPLAPILRGNENAESEDLPMFDFAAQKTPNPATSAAGTKTTSSTSSPCPPSHEPPPPSRQTRTEQSCHTQAAAKTHVEREIIHRELQKAGYSMKDIELVIGILGTDGQKAAQALTLMNQLRSEGFERDGEAWKNWLIAKYL